MYKRKSYKPAHKQIRKHKTNKIKGGGFFDFSRNTTNKKQQAFTAIVPTNSNSNGNTNMDNKLHSKNKIKPTPATDNAIHPGAGANDVKYIPNDTTDAGKKEFRETIYKFIQIYNECKDNERYFNKDEWIKIRKGLITEWDVSNITDMGGLFSTCEKFNENISRWNVSNVTNMSRMFYGCKEFNQPLNSWNVSKVTNMEGMFDNCEKFNQPLDNWNVSNVNNMNGMFHNAIAFNHPLNKWRVSNKTDMIGMFKNAKNFNDPKILESWNLKPKYEYKGHKKEMFTHADAMQDYLKSVFLGGRRKTRKRRHI